MKVPKVNDRYFATIVDWDSAQEFENRAHELQQAFAALAHRGSRDDWTPSATEEFYLMGLLSRLVDEVVSIGNDALFGARSRGWRIVDCKVVQGEAGDEKEPTEGPAK